MKPCLKSQRRPKYKINIKPKRNFCNVVAAEEAEGRWGGALVSLLSCWPFQAPMAVLVLLSLQSHHTLHSYPGCSLFTQAYYNPSLTAHPRPFSHPRVPAPPAWGFHCSFDKADPWNALPLWGCKTYPPSVGTTAGSNFLFICLQAH